MGCLRLQGRSGAMHMEIDIQETGRMVKKSNLALKAVTSKLSHLEQSVDCLVNTMCSSPKRGSVSRTSIDPHGKLAPEGASTHEGPLESGDPLSLTRSEKRTQPTRPGTNSGFAHTKRPGMRKPANNATLWDQPGTRGTVEPLQRVAVHCTDAGFLERAGDRPVF